MQKESLVLMEKLCDDGFEVMLETSGSLPISEVDERVKIIMDLKTPSSKMMKKNLYENIDHLKKFDEIKFVMGSKEDYDWSKKILKEYELENKFVILFSSIFGKIEQFNSINWL